MKNLVKYGTMFAVSVLAIAVVERSPKIKKIVGGQ